MSHGRGRARRCRGVGPRLGTLVHTAGAACAALSASSASAQTGPITNNRYAVEFFQGPLLAPSNIEALAGATTAVAEGVNGAATNAAAPGVRDPYSVRWVDVDLDAGLSLPGAFTKMDYDNHGAGSDDEVNNFVHVDFGARIQLGQLGLSASGELLRYTVASRGGLDVTAGRYDVLAGYGFFGNQLALGVGFRAVTMQLAEGRGLVDTLNPVGASFTMTGLGPEVGMIFKPDGYPFRIGATVRSTVTGDPFGSARTQTDLLGVVRTGAVIVPDSVTLPWEIEGGVAIQVGPRPLNPHWVHPDDDDAEIKHVIAKARERRAITYAEALAETVPEARAQRRAELERQETAIRALEEQRLSIEEDRLREARRARYESLSRQKILFLASVLATGASANAIALEDFFLQRYEAYGESVTLSPRLGLETEPIEGRFKMRLGTYLEPSRFDGVAPRGHFTTGFDLKLLRWDAFGLLPNQVWCLSGVADVAPRYTDWGFSVGAWH